MATLWEQITNFSVDSPNGLGNGRTHLTLEVWGQPSFLRVKEEPQCATIVLSAQHRGQPWSATSLRPRVSTARLPMDSPRWEIPTSRFACCPAPKSPLSKR